MACILISVYQVPLFGNFDVGSSTGLNRYPDWFSEDFPSLDFQVSVRNVKVKKETLIFVNIKRTTKKREQCTFSWRVTQAPKW